MSENIELTILMPCLNEAETLEICIRKASSFLEKSGIAGEILIADNGSTDESVEIAKRCGAGVVNVETKGYGAALDGGCRAARGKYVIMGDADDSYDFSNLMPFVEKLREGYDLVMGNRFKGGIEKGAMPPLHRYIGNPVLSFIGRLFYSSDIGDFHCGLRGYCRESVLNLNLQTTGMEYASEMIVKATMYGLKITEVPTTLSVDGRSRAPHLRSFRDGWRHLKFLLMHSPDWLFLYPGIAFTVVGAGLMFLLAAGPIQIKTITLDIHTMLYGAGFVLLGINTIFFALFTRIYAMKTQFIPIKQTLSEKMAVFTTEKGVVFGGILTLAGMVLSIAAFCLWSGNSFGELEPQKMMRLVISALTMIIAGIETIYAGFFIGILQMNAERALPRFKCAEH